MAAVGRGLERPRQWAVAWRRGRSPAAADTWRRVVAVALVTAALPGVMGKISPTGFTNPYYQAFRYMGSRVLEYNVTGRHETYVEATWSQAVTVDPEGALWIVDRTKHQVLKVPPQSCNVSWPACYEPYAGIRSRFGFYDGDRSTSMFNGPSGIAYSPADANGGHAMLYVADTNNHCIRALNLTSKRTVTVAGNHRRMGLRDGPSSQARFNYPVSLGVDPSGNSLFVLDGRHIRLIDLSRRPSMTTTLAEGACRSLEKWTVSASVVLRKVACHSDWRMVDTGTHVDVYKTNVTCRGHDSTCGPRHHPALRDEESNSLRFKGDTIAAAV